MHSFFLCILQNHDSLKTPAYSSTCTNCTDSLSETDVTGAEMSLVVRVSICLNSSAKKGSAQAVVTAAPKTEAILTAAANKLRLKKKEVAKARLFIWQSGYELPRGEDDGVAGRVHNGDLIAVSLGEPYQGPGTDSRRDGEIEAVASGSRLQARPARWLRWEARLHAAGSLGVIEWCDAGTMNASLGRMSTLLEHPTLCAAEAGRVVSTEEQRTLPSSKYEGHNLYAHTLREFERLASEAGAGSHASPAESAFLALWRTNGAPEVLICYVAGAEKTLRHELCHARFALDGAYRGVLLDAWETRWSGTLGRWMRDLGYHHTRHADEFGAYVLTEPASFWRGRVPADEVRALRGALCADAERGDGGRTEGSGGGNDSGRGSGETCGDVSGWVVAPWEALPVSAAVAAIEISSWWGAAGGGDSMQGAGQAEVPPPPQGEGGAGPPVDLGLGLGEPAAAPAVEPAAAPAAAPAADVSDSHADSGRAIATLPSCSSSPPAR